MALNDFGQEDLNTLQDMFGGDSPALRDQLRLARLKALQESLGKAQAQDLVNQQSIPGSNSGYSNTPQSAQDIVDSQSLPGKTAADSAKTFESMPRTAAESAETLQGAPELPEAPSAPQPGALSSEQALKQMSMGEQPGAMSSEEALAQMSHGGSEAASAAADAPLSTEGALSKMASAAPEVETAAAEGAGAEAAGGALGLGPLAAAGVGLLAGKGVEYIGSGAMEDDIKNLLKGSQSTSPSSTLTTGVAADAAGSGDASNLDARIVQNKKILDLMGNGGLPRPYGGLTGKALDDSIKASPGPVATTGNNPGNTPPSSSVADNEDGPNSTPPMDRPGDEDSRSVASSGPAKILSKLQALRSNPTQNPAPVQDTLAKLLGQNQDEMRDAQQQRNQLQLLAMLGHAGAQAGQALTPLAKTMPDNTAFNTLMQAAQQPLSDIKAKQDMASGILKNQMLKGQAQTEINKTDPNSAISQAAREFYEKTTHKQANPSMTASDMEKLDPMLARIFTSEENAKNRAAWMVSTRADKTGKDQDKAYSDAVQKVASFRGNAGAQQASRNILSVDNALSLLDMPGARTTQDLKLIADEMGKIATGGVPSEHGVQALMPNNLKTKYAELKNFISSSPTDAEADEYLARNKAYLKDMSTVARKNIYDYSKSIAKGFKNRLKPEDYEELNKDIESKYGSQKSTHPQDDEAIAWAKANPSNPMAAQILKANGL